MISFPRKNVVGDVCRLTDEVPSKKSAADGAEEEQLVWLGVGHIEPGTIWPETMCQNRGHFVWLGTHLCAKIWTLCLLRIKRTCFGLGHHRIVIIGHPDIWHKDKRAQ